MEGAKRLHMQVEASPESCDDHGIPDQNLVGILSGPTILSSNDIRMSKPVVISLRHPHDPGVSDMYPVVGGIDDPLIIDPLSKKD